MRRIELLTKAEIHHFGVEIVHGQMERDGFEILGVNPSMTVTPQIVARKNGQLCFVVVRTDFYPNRGTLANDEDFFYNLGHAERNNALCYFAGVRLCNAAATDAGDEEGMSLPVKGADFYVEYEGLKIMTTLDRMKVRDGRGLRDLEEREVKPAIVKSFSEAIRSAASQK
ncbi:MAG TPA: hypothetical protein PLR20_09550 [Syntrophales bacterium]|jgi:hypothetical protein|nr:hypothetical protein [Syntrophales bacterium]HOX94091.1 hypothetical protein [Syntrophales bacterium]HPI58009.1 hypothetical protein [Syntrophales bacterium]HPN25863.1 hypothetical protein [Syntrophales bacterium]HQM29581.1 hypothetical protein [Syntrophales bacterium]